MFKIKSIFLLICIQMYLGPLHSYLSIGIVLNVVEYLDDVAGTIASHNKKCRNDIALANEKLDEMVQSEEGKEELNNLFR